MNARAAGPWIATCAVLAFAGCGRIGFGASGGADDGAADAASDGAPVLAPVTCPVVRTPSTAGAVEVIVEAGPADPRLVVWRRGDDHIDIGYLEATDHITVERTDIGGAAFERVLAAYPIGNGHAFVADIGGVEALYHVTPDLLQVSLRGQGEHGVGRAPLAGMGDTVMWAHLALGTTTGLVIERLDASAMTTTHANRTTAQPVTDIMIGGATPTHAHVVWGEAGEACRTSEVFVSSPGFDDVGTFADCRVPRNAAGLDDAIVMLYRTPAGALRLNAESPTFQHDVELSPAGHDPVVADDGAALWLAWLDDRVAGALVLAKVTIDSAAVSVTARVLTDVAPIGPAGVALVDDVAPMRLVVAESGQFAVVRPCL